MCNRLQTDVDMIESGKSTAVRWGNRLGYIILPFHLAMHDDPLEYIRKAKQVIVRKKNSLEVIIIHMAVEIIFKILGPKVRLLPFILYACMVFINIKLQKARSPTSQVSPSCL